MTMTETMPEIAPILISSLPASMSQEDHQSARRQFAAMLSERWELATDELKSLFAQIPDHLRTEAMRLCCLGAEPKLFVQNVISSPNCLAQLEAHVQYLAHYRTQRRQHSLET